MCIFEKIKPFFLFFFTDSGFHYVDRLDLIHDFPIQTC